MCSFKFPTLQWGEGWGGGLHMVGAHKHFIGMGSIKHHQKSVIPKLFHNQKYVVGKRRFTVVRMETHVGYDDYNCFVNSDCKATFAHPCRIDVGSSDASI